MMHEMRTTATDEPVAWCVCLSVARLRTASTDPAGLFGVRDPGTQITSYCIGFPAHSMRTSPNYFGYLPYHFWLNVVVLVAEGDERPTTTMDEDDAVSYGRLYGIHLALYLCPVLIYL